MGPVWTQELHELQLTGGGKRAPHLWAAPHAPCLGGLGAGMAGRSSGPAGKAGARTAPAAQPGKGPGAPWEGLI